ncbi:BspA family leucine-rich repeat surface protein [Segatella copri]|uniref:BspA family leucine-rich repeat surface protein n=1 Tax=Segatella copri TaxID=165179 RepID=A0AA92TZR2_9BACT|nr:BspA family leucine-rich repeat surface protein [Segatella copri]RGW44383.1 BspA family leucine-rich repeat surface protein [Segatella copri]
MMKRFTNQSNGSQAGRMNNGGAKFCRFALFPLMLLMLLLLPAGMVAQKAASSSKYIATYESSTQTLTFKKNVGETLPKNSAWVKDKWTVATIKNKLGNGTIVHIVFDKSFSTYTPTSLYCFFEGLTELETITGLEYLNTENVTNMGRMFYDCSKLTSLDVSKFNTANVTNMSYMFYNCKALTSLDVTHFNTANVTNMGYIFYICSSLTSLDVTHFNTAKVTDMRYMFSSCSSLTSLDVTNFKTANVANMSYMFSGCSALLSLDVTNFNTANVTNMSTMFYNCSKLTSLYLTNFNTEKVTSMEGMFSRCKALTTIYASSKFVTTQVSNSSSMFYNCEKLKGEVVVWTKGNATDKTYAKIEGGYFSRAIPRVKYADGTLTFFLASKETLGENEYGIYGLGAKPDWVWKNPNVTKVTKVVFDPAFANARPTNCYAWFQGYVNLTSIEGIEYLNTSQVTDMHNMFSECSHLQTTDFSGFDTRKVKDMSYMFHNCGSLKSLDISNFNTSEVTDMRGMFESCIGLTSLDLSHLNTSKVSVMASMFQSCINLLSVNLSGWDTRNVISMTRMFKRCHSLKTLDLSGFDTREKTCTMGDMFNTCKELTTIFVSDKFAVGTGDTGDGTMFQGCNKLKGANALDKNNPQTGIDNANYKTGYFTKLVGKNGDEKIGAAREPLATDNLALDDNKDFVAYEKFAAKDASYSRTMNAGTTWGTLCLPFGIDQSQETECKFYRLTGIDNDNDCITLESYEEGAKIPAGTPVLFKMNEGEQTLSISAQDAGIVTEPKAGTNTDVNLVGSFTKIGGKDNQGLADTDYIIGKDKFWRVSDLNEGKGVGIKPMRAYIHPATASQARAVMLSIGKGDGTTAIDNLNAISNDANAEYYDANGRRTNGLQKGLNIVKRGSKTYKIMVK